MLESKQGKLESFTVDLYQLTGWFLSWIMKQPEKSSEIKGEVYQQRALK